MATKPAPTPSPLIPGVSFLDSASRELVADFTFDRLPTVKFRVAHITRSDGLVKIQERARRIEWDKEQRMNVQTLDADVLAADLAGAIMRGWTGLTVETLAVLVPLDVGEGVDAKTPIPFTPETAVYLLKNGNEFSKWVTTTASDPANFVGVSALPRNAQSAI